MVELRPVDAVEVTLVVDNFVDVLMASAEGVRRFPLAFDSFERDRLVAEHGFSALVTIEAEGSRSSILYDGGLSPQGLARNLDVLQIATPDLRAMVISHGHADHHGGLEGVAARFPNRLPLIIHPGAWRERKVRFPGGTELRLPPPSMTDLEREGLEVVEERGPTLLVDDRILVSGQVERVTEFEQGFPIHLARAEDGGWEPDPLILDDQNVIVDVAGKGLVVVSGCSHAGAVNVLRNAQRLTGRRTIAGFVGGFHLSGAVFEPIIEPTVREFAALGVGRMVPGHCTGWKAQHLLARAMPEAFVQPSVGTVLRF